MPLSGYIIGPQLSSTPRRALVPLPTASPQLPLPTTMFKAVLATILGAPDLTVPPQDKTIIVKRVEVRPLGIIGHEAKKRRSHSIPWSAILSLSYFYIDDCIKIDTDQGITVTFQANVAQLCDLRLDLLGCKKLLLVNRHSRRFLSDPYIYIPTESITMELFEDESDISYEEIEMKVLGKK